MFGVRFLLRILGSSVRDIGDCCSDKEVAAAEEEAESVSGIGQFHFGGRPKFSSTSPVNQSPSTIDTDGYITGGYFAWRHPQANVIFLILAKRK
jgi:hypothetical protein